MSKKTPLLMLCFLPSCLFGSEGQTITTLSISNTGQDPSTSLLVSSNSRLKKPIFESFDECEFYLFKQYKKYFEGNAEYETAILSSEYPKQPYLYYKIKDSSFDNWEVCVDLNKLVPFMDD